MKYRRKRYRPPRQVEKTEAMRERDVLRDRLDSKNRRVRELEDEVRRLGLEAEKLLLDKVALGMELRDARTMIELLTGQRDRGGHALMRRFG